MTVHPDFHPHCVWTGAGYLDPFNIRTWEDDVLCDVPAIARGLARRARFGGHTLGDWPYSVAQHSVLCASLAADLHLSPSLERVCLLHDAAEAFTGLDVPQPLKARDAMWAFVKAEGALQDAILAAFRLSEADEEWAPVVHAIDRIALAIERRWLIAPEAGDWPGVPDPVRQTVPLVAMDPREAEQLFLRRAADLGLIDAGAAA